VSRAACCLLTYVDRGDSAMSCEYHTYAVMFTMFRLSAALQCFGCMKVNNLCIMCVCDLGYEVSDVHTSLPSTNTATSLAILLLVVCKPEGQGQWAARVLHRQAVLA
jgi:hypothetical protein